MSRFDLFILVLNPTIFTRKERVKYGPYQETVWENHGDEVNAYDFIASLKQDFNKPIFVISNEGVYILNHASIAKFKSAGVNALFGIPFSPDEFQIALKTYLKVPNISFPESNEITTQKERIRPFKVVIVNDEEGPLRSFEIVLQSSFNNVKILTFENPAEAWQELLQSDPDLLITDDRMAGVSGLEICQSLLARQATYPVIMHSAFEPTEPEWVRKLAGGGLNISFLHVPCDVESILKAVESALKIPRVQIEQSLGLSPQFFVNKRTLKIVILDENSFPPELMEVVIKQSFQNAIVQTFRERGKGLLELSLAEALIY